MSMNLESNYIGMKVMQRSKCEKELFKFVADEIEVNVKG